MKIPQPLNDSMRMTIPRILRVIYEHRNKRGGAYNSSFDLLKMGYEFVVPTSNRVMEELTRLYLTKDPIAKQALINNLLSKIYLWSRRLMAIT